MSWRSSLKMFWKFYYSFIVIPKNERHTIPRTQCIHVTPLLYLPLLTWVCAVAVWPVRDRCWSRGPWQPKVMYRSLYHTWLNPTPVRSVCVCVCVCIVMRSLCKLISQCVSATSISSRFSSPYPIPQHISNALKVFPHYKFHLMPLSADNHLVIITWLLLISIWICVYSSRSQSGHT